MNKLQGKEYLGNASQLLGSGSVQRMGRPLAWPELRTSKWAITWKTGWRSWRWKLSRHHYGWTAETPWLVVMFTKFAKRPTAKLMGGTPSAPDLGETASVPSHAAPGSETSNYSGAPLAESEGAGGDSNPQAEGQTS